MLKDEDGTTCELASATDSHSHADRCGSPICACDPDSIRLCIWYPDEPICSMLRANEPAIARRMRRIAKVAKTAARPEPDEPGYPGLADSYFTIEDLRSMRRVDRRMVGRDPDRSYDLSGTPTHERKPVPQPEAILRVVS